MNGSQLKEKVKNYKGTRAGFKSIVVHPSEIVVSSEAEEIIISCPYIGDIDEKKDIVGIK